MSTKQDASRPDYPFWTEGIKVASELPTAKFIIGGTLASLTVLGYSARESPMMFIGVAALICLCGISALHVHKRKGQADVQVSEIESPNYAGGAIKTQTASKGDRCRIDNGSYLPRIGGVRTPLGAEGKRDSTAHEKREE